MSRHKPNRSECFFFFFFLPSTYIVCHVVAMVSCVHLKWSLTPLGPPLPIKSLVSAPMSRKECGPSFSFALKKQHTKFLRLEKTFPNFLPQLSIQLSHPPPPPLSRRGGLRTRNWQASVSLKLFDLYSSASHIYCLAISRCGAAARSYLMREICD